MRSLAILCLALGLAACRTAPVARSDSRAVSASQVTSMESVREFLLTSAATDFHTHRPPDPVRFRDVRLGHVMTPGQEEQYMLCGHFLSAQQESKGEWTPFATIKTSGYEQLIGAQAAAFCQGASVEWDERGDLSSSLQRRLDGLR